MRALIADDEPVARQVLREHLEDIGGIEIVAEVEDGLRAVAEIARLDPDVVFLDLRMPELDGFAVARSLRGGGPRVVFVTAFDNRAVDAFGIGAADYLLKPVRRERLEAAIARLRPGGASPVQPGAARGKDLLRRVIGRRGDDYHVIDPGDVIAFQASGEEVHVLSVNGRYAANHTMRALEDRLPSPPFRRVHRKTIINTDHIRKISPLSSKRWLLEMSNGLEAVVSKRLAAVVRQETDW